VEPPFSGESGGAGTTEDDGLIIPDSDMNTVAGRGGSEPPEQPAAPGAGEPTGVAGTNGYSPPTDKMDGGIGDGAVDTGVIPSDGGEDDAGQDTDELSL
jgi:hypothetical protein